MTRLRVIRKSRQKGQPLTCGCLKMVMRRQTFTAPWVKPVYVPGLLVAMTVRRLYGEIGGAIKERVVIKALGKAGRTVPINSRQWILLLTSAQRNMY